MLKLGWQAARWSNCAFNTYKMGPVSAANIVVYNHSSLQQIYHPYSKFTHGGNAADFTGGLAQWKLIDF